MHQCHEKLSIVLLHILERAAHPAERLAVAQVVGWVFTWRFSDAPVPSAAVLQIHDGHVMPGNKRPTVELAQVVHRAQGLLKHLRAHDRGADGEINATAQAVDAMRKSRGVRSAGASKRAAVKERVIHDDVVPHAHVHGQRHAMFVRCTEHAETLERMRYLQPSVRQPESIECPEQIRAGSRQAMRWFISNQPAQRIGRWHVQAAVDDQLANGFTEALVLRAANDHRQVDPPARFIPRAEAPDRGVVAHRFTASAKVRKFPVVNDARTLRGQVRHPAPADELDQQRARAVFDQVCTVSKHHRCTAFSSRDDFFCQRRDVRCELRRQRRQRLRQDRFLLNVGVADPLRKWQHAQSGRVEPGIGHVVTPVRVARPAPNPSSLINSGN